MVIGVDIRMLTRGMKTGVEEYTVNLLSNMLPLDKSVKYKLFYNGYKKVKLCNYKWLNLRNVELMMFNIPNRLLDLSFRFLKYPKIDELLNGVDVFFSPHIFLSSVSENCPSVVTFHDLSFEKHPEFYSASKNYWHFSMYPKSQAERAKRIIAVSQSTKDDLVQLYGINPDKIKVVYSGVNTRDQKLGMLSDKQVEKQNSALKFGDIMQKYNLPDKYILYLGTLEPRKNVVGLIKAFEKLNETCSKNRHYKYKLVIAGSKGWLYNDIIKTAKNSSAKNDIIFTGFVDDKDKPALYSLAQLFVYPSFYEGFGFPPLEAMLYGVPVVTSNFSSLPEAVSAAAVMVDPYDLDGLSKAMEMILVDESLKTALIKKGLEQVKKFSWRRCAKETLSEILSVQRSNLLL